jgi:catechol 2,3-dioxygenase-like lactoylglutathione lyase family enzyme
VPRFKKVVPVLKSSDMQRSVDFYTGVLGFALQWRAPGDGGDEHCMLRLGDADLMLSTGGHLGGQPCFTGALYFGMEGVDAYHAGVKDNVDLVWPLEDMEYRQREFGLRDPDGYTLAFAEERNP